MKGRTFYSEVNVRILLVFNPRAGHKRGKKILTEVLERFENKGVKVTLCQTDYPGHGMEIVQQAPLCDYDALVTAGGDGMVFELINGYYRQRGDSNVPLGVIPIGTGNAFARDLGLRRERWQEAVDAIALHRKCRVDVGRFTTGGRDYYYLNILGFGFVADVSKTAQTLKIFGDSAYLLGVFYQTLLLHTYQLTLEIEGEVLNRENIFVEISNTRYTGVNFLMSPKARIDDGLLDITLLGKMSRTRLLRCLPKIFTGEHIHLEEVETFQARKMKFETDIPKILTPDGELMGSTPIEVECLPRAVEVFYHQTDS